MSENESEYSKLGRYISRAGNSIGTGILIGALLLGTCGRCERKIKIEYVNQPAVEELQQNYETLDRRVQELERR